MYLNLLIAASAKIEKMITPSLIKLRKLMSRVVYFIKISLTVLFNASMILLLPFAIADFFIIQYQFRNGTNPVELESLDAILPKISAKELYEIDEDDYLEDLSGFASSIWFYTYHIMIPNESFDGSMLRRLHHTSPTVLFYMKYMAISSKVMRPKKGTIVKFLTRNVDARSNEILKRLDFLDHPSKYKNNRDIEKEFEFIAWYENSLKQYHIYCLKWGTFFGFTYIMVLFYLVSDEQKKKKVALLKKKRLQIKFEKETEKMLNRLEENQNKYSIHELHNKQLSKNGQVLIYSEILFVEKVKNLNKMIYHNTRGLYVTENNSLKECELTDKRMFFEISQSIIVNIHYIDEIESDRTTVVLKNGTKLKLTKDRYKNLNLAMNKYIGIPV